MKFDTKTNIENPEFDGDICFFFLNRKHLFLGNLIQKIKTVCLIYLDLLEYAEFDEFVHFFYLDRIFPISEEFRLKNLNCLFQIKIFT